MHRGVQTSHLFSAPIRILYKRNNQCLRVQSMIDGYNGEVRAVMNHMRTNQYRWIMRALVICSVMMRCGNIMGHYWARMGFDLET